jgi:hypothetical protein
VAKKFPINPSNPERICWGCDKYCPADDMACGNGSDRTQHPAELFGPDWNEWEPPATTPQQSTLNPAPQAGPTLKPESSR